MTTLATTIDTSTTSVMLVRQIREPALVGLILVGLGTSSAATVSQSSAADFGFHASTSAGVGLPARTGGTAMAELRRRSGLTWEQLSRLFGVSRRALHFWASGKSMTPANEEHLQRVLGVLRRLDRGIPAETRAKLIEAGVDGVTPFDLLRVGRYEQALAVVGLPETALLHPRWSTNETLAARAPLPPAILAEALQDRPKTHPRSVRPAASVKVRRG